MKYLTAYKNTDKTITVTLPASISGATDVKLYISPSEIGGDYIISGATGTTVSGVTTFEITATQNNVDEYVYFFDVIAIYNGKTHNIANGTYSILPSMT